MKRTILLISIMLTVIASVSAQGNREEADGGEGIPRFVTIASGPSGGGWYMLGGTVADLISREFPQANVNVTTGGAVANPSVVSQGRAEIGLTQDNLYHEARKGTGPFEETGELTNISGALYFADIYMSQFLVRSGFALESIEQLKQEEIPVRLVTSTRGSSPAGAAERMFAEYGITFEDIESWGGQVAYVSYSEASSLITDGHADAYIGPVVAAIQELSVSRDLRLLPIREDVVDTLAETYRYGKVVIPENEWYFVTEDTVTMSEPVILFVNDSLSDEFVYRMLKAIEAQPDRIRNVGTTYRDFSIEQGSDIRGGPLHTGAQRFFEER